jgi:hypothetical protein
MAALRWESSIPPFYWRLVYCEETAMAKLLILAVLIAVLVYPVGGGFFVRKRLLRNQGSREHDRHG